MPAIETMRSLRHSVERRSSDISETALISMSHPRACLYFSDVGEFEFFAVSTNTATGSGSRR